MFRARWRIMRLAGIPIFVDASWLIILALLTLSFAGGFPEILNRFFPGGGNLAPSEFWIMGLITALAFFVCILLHELGHALVARARGMPINGITLFIFGGVAELGDEPPSAATEFLMAIAGPVVSLVLAIAFWLLAIVGYQFGWPHPAVLVLGYLGFLNATVLVFNLIPAFPLDGGRVLRSILWGATGSLRRSTHWASILGQAFAWLFIGIGILELFSGQWMSGIWTGLIGMFLNNAAQSSYQQVLVRQALQGQPVRRFMTREPITVPPSLDLLHWVDDFVYRFHHRAFPVASNGDLEGVITTQALNDVPREEWGRHTVGEVMSHDLRGLTIPADADAMQALKNMQLTGSSRLLVTDHRHLLGIVSIKDLLGFLRVRMSVADQSPSD